MCDFSLLAGEVSYWCVISGFFLARLMYGCHILLPPLCFDLFHLLLLELPAKEISVVVGVVNEARVVKVALIFQRKGKHLVLWLLLVLLGFGSL